MGIKISEYANTATSLSASDLTDISKLISTGPNVWQTQKLPYSVLLTELESDLNFVDGSGTLNYIPRFTAAGSIGDGSMQDDTATTSIGGALDATMKMRIYANVPFGLYVDNTAASGSQHISLYGKSIAANTASNTGFYGEALGSTGGTNLGARGKAANLAIQDSATDILYAGAHTGGFFQANKSGAYVTYGLVGSADTTSLEAASTHVGGFFRAVNAGTKYSLRLVDSTEGVGKFLKSIDASGHANWATVNDYAADASPDSAADYFLVWDTSASLHKKVLMSNVPSSAVTLYNTDSTFSAARTAKLSGNTSSEFLSFQTLAGVNVLKVKGDNSIDFGVSGGNFISKHYMRNGDSALYYRNDGTLFCSFNGSAGSLSLFDAAGSGTVMSFSQASNSGRFNLYGNDGALRVLNNAGSSASTYSYGGACYTYYVNNAGSVKASIWAQGYMSLGADSAFAYNLEITGTSWFNGAVHNVKGADVASAGNLTLTTNSHIITGTTTINALTIAPYVAGDHITLVFTGATTVKHNTAGGAGTAVFKLAGSVDFVTAADTVLGIYYDGTVFQQTFEKHA